MPEKVGPDITDVVAFGSSGTGTEDGLAPLFGNPLFESDGGEVIETIENVLKAIFIVYAFIE